MRNRALKKIHLNVVGYDRDELNCFHLKKYFVTILYVVRLLFGENNYRKQPNNLAVNL